MAKFSWHQEKKQNLALKIASEVSEEVRSADESDPDTVKRPVAAEIKTEVPVFISGIDMASPTVSQSRH